tara:strand:+ start:1027 stop:1218 length:192 start_codon:yes stop_codon:yes gene_type:complete
MTLTIKEQSDEYDELITAYAETRAILVKVWEESETNDNVLSEDTMNEVYEFLEKYRHQNEAWS